MPLHAHRYNGEGTLHTLAAGTSWQVPLVTNTFPSFQHRLNSSSQYLPYYNDYFFIKY